MGPRAMWIALAAGFVLGTVVAGAGGGRAGALAASTGLAAAVVAVALIALARIWRPPR
jgi:hypothetical protein